MANNKTFQDGRRLNVPVEAGTVSGSPCVVGSRCGVALTTRDAAGNASVDFKGVYELTVTGATVPGTPIYYTANANPALRLGIVATALFFGYAMETQAGPGAGLIDVYVSEASGISTLAAGSLAGTVVANVADVNVIGGIPLIFRVDVADAAGDTDVLSTHKVRVLDFWFQNTGVAAHANTDTIQLFNGANAITDVIAKTATVNGIRRCSTIDPATHEINAGGTLRITAAKGAGALNVAATAYVLAVRVA